jgi:tetratricopeptide (TPR) repeat protein
MVSDSSRGKNHLRNEMLARIKDAVESKDWNQLEKISKQWIELDPSYPAPFKWLARASVALGQVQKAAYAYGRYLDFDKNFDEAKKFFKEHPSSLDTQPQNVRQTVGMRVSQIYQNSDKSDRNAVTFGETVLSKEDRRIIAEQELLLAEIYKKYSLHNESSEHFYKSFQWTPSKSAALGFATELNKLSRGNEAIRFLREQLFSYPDWNEGRLLLGKILYDIGLRNDAQKEWQIVLDYDPNSKEALNNLRNLLAFSV